MKANLEEARKLAAKIRFDRPYKTGKEFLDWTEMSLFLAASFRECSMQVNPSTLLLANHCGQWLAKNAPLYAVKKTALDFFEEIASPATNEKILCDINLPAPYALLLFPKNHFQIPGMGSLDWTVLDFCDLQDPHLYIGDDQAFRKTFRYQLSIMGVSSQFRSWYWSIYINENGSISDPPGPTDNQIAFGEEAFDESEKVIINKIKHACLQTLLAATYEPQLLTSQASPVPRRKKKGVVKDPIWYPRIVKAPDGAGQQAILQSSSSGCGNGKKRPHWRSYHWRNQAVGKGRKERSPRLIKTTFVNAQ